ncbi:MFS transporter [Dactylosporangium sp. NPDC005572]|uniref:MFS transporter n=1 Tax=Dactylosporangium sp. NPDC005572 TaxID=3156889 RepID=UPI00339E9AEE
MSTSTSLLRDRDFVLFAGGQGVSALGDALSKTALPLLVLAITGSGLHMGIIAMLNALPLLVLGVPAGAWADRMDRRRMMLWSDVGRALLVALVPLAVVLDIPLLPVLYAIAVPIGVLYAVFEAACLSCVPALVGRERLGEANSLLSIGNALGFVIGPSLAGVLMATVRGGLTLAVDALTFAVSALTLMFIRRPLQEAAQRPTGPMGDQIREGLVFIRGHRLLRSTVLYWSAITFLTSPIIICATFFLRVDLGWSPRILGLIIATYAGGAIVGALVASRLRQAAGLMMFGGTVVGGVALLVLSVASWLPLTLGVAVLAGMGEAVAGIFYTTLRAQLTPDELLGRVTTTVQVATFGLRPLSVFVAGVALELTSGAATLATIGVACLLVSALFAWRNNLFQPRTAAVPTPTERASKAG